jgi:hypothetical protein
LISEAALILPIEKPKTKHSMLPLLTILFVISYVLMVLLVVEQNRTITSQRWLITELMSDSKELTTLKCKMLSDQRNNQKQHGSKMQSKTPPSQGTREMNSRSKRGNGASDRPPRLTSDVPDTRRALNAI